MLAWRQPPDSNAGATAWLLTGFALGGFPLVFVFLLVPSLLTLLIIPAVLTTLALLHALLTRRVSSPWATGLAIPASFLLLVALFLRPLPTSVLSPFLLLAVGLGIAAERLWAHDPGRLGSAAARLGLFGTGLLLGVGWLDPAAGLAGLLVVLASLAAPLPNGARATIAVLSASPATGLGNALVDFGADAFVGRLLAWLAFFAILAATWFVVRLRPRPGAPPRASGPPGSRALTIALHVVVPVLVVLAVGLAAEVGGAPDGRPDARLVNLLAAGMLVVGALAMVSGWRLGVGRTGEAAALTGGWLWTLLGFVLADPPTWALVPGFLLPWLLLLVELPPRHRLLLLLFQWLATAMLYETMTQETTSTVLLFALGLLHVVLVAAGLQGRWMRGAVLVGVALSLVVLGTSLVFALRDPTARRLLWVAAGTLMLAATVWFLYSGALSRLRPPTLVNARHRQPPVSEANV